MFSKRLNTLNPYIPGEQPEGSFIKINANENPYAPPKYMLEKLSEYILQNGMDFALYPDPESVSLRKAIAAMLNESGGFLQSKEKLEFAISEDMIFCGNGSDEVLSFIFYTFFDSDKELVLPELTYSFYPVYADYYDIPLKKIALKNDWALDTEAMLTVENSGGMIFANPNAPTGIALSVLDIESMLESFPKEKVLVVDEAYVDFSTETTLPLLQKYKNLVIVRTFSKSFSFAGMRLGFCIAHPELIDAIMKVKNSFNHFPVDAFTQKFGTLVCENWKEYADTAKTIAFDRDMFTKVLRKNGWEVIPSATNFVMAKHNAGLDGLAVYEVLKKHSFLVRYFDNPKTSDWVRITIGKTQDMITLAKIMCKLSK